MHGGHINFNVRINLYILTVVSIIFQVKRGNVDHILCIHIFLFCFVFIFYLISLIHLLQVSLDSRVREVINRNMVDPTPHTFDEAQLQIYTLMHRDSYPRFLNSQMYKKLLEESQLSWTLENLINFKFTTGQIKVVSHDILVLCCWISNERCELMECCHLDWWILCSSNQSAEWFCWFKKYIPSSNNLDCQQRFLQNNFVGNFVICSLWLSHVCDV